MRVGCGDRNKAHLFFDIKTSETLGSLHVFPLRGSAALEILDNITELKYLDGHACWIEVEENTVHRMGLAKV